MNDPTRFTDVEVEKSIKAPSFEGALNGTFGAKHLTYSDSATVPASDVRPILAITASAASKTVTLGLPDGSACIVVNEGGTNAFTLKNVSTDSGVSVAAGKAVVAVIGASGALATYAIN